MLNLQSGCKTVEDAKRDTLKAHNERVEASYSHPEQAASTKSPNWNMDHVNMTKVANMHAESIAADPQTFRANMKRRGELDARTKRLESGKGTMADLVHKYNSFKA